MKTRDTKIQGGYIHFIICPSPLAASASGQQGLRAGAGLKDHVSIDLMGAGEREEWERATGMRHNFSSKSFLIEALIETESMCEFFFGRCFLK